MPLWHLTTQVRNPINRIAGRHCRHTNFCISSSLHSIHFLELISSPFLQFAGALSVCGDAIFRDEAVLSLEMIPQNREHYRGISHLAERGISLTRLIILHFLFILVVIVYLQFMLLFYTADKVLHILYPKIAR